MKKNTLKHIYIKCLLIVLLIVVPLYLHDIYVEYQLFSAGKNQLEQHISDQTNEMILSFDKEVQNLEKTALSIQNSSIIRAYYYDTPGNMTNEKRMIIDELFSLTQTNALISDILVCIKKNQAVYSSTGLYSLHTIVPDILHFSSWSESQFIYDISTANSLQWRKQENIIGKGSFITMLYPIPAYNDSPYATVLFFISKQDFSDRLLKFATDDTVIQVLDRKSDIIYSSDQSSRFTIPGFSAQDENKILECKDNSGDQYYYSFNISPRTGFTFMTLIPAESISSQMEYPLSGYLLKGIVRGVIMSLLAVLLSFFLCLPFRRISRKASQLSDNDGDHRKNDYDIFQVLDDYDKNNKVLESRLTQVRQPVRLFLYGRILQGEFESLSQVNESYAEYGISFNMTYYFVVNVQLSDFEKEESNFSIIQKLLNQQDKWSVNKYEIHIKYSVPPGFFYIIMGSSSNNAAQIEYDLKKMRNIIAVILNCNVSFSVGGISEGFSSIAQSFMESCSISRYQIIYGKNEVLMPDILHTPRNLPEFYPSTLINELNENLKVHDRAGVETALNNLEDHISKTNHSPEIIRCIIYDVISILLKVSEGLGKEAYNSNFAAIYARLASIQSINELSDIIMIVVRLFPEKEEDAMKSVLDISSVYEYIRQNYCDYDFSVQNMADHFGVSSSNMTHFFKKNAGVTVLDYVNTKRIDQVANLLANTDMMLKDIVKSVGFSDTSTFIKKFRSVYGITPGQYRENTSQ